MRDIWAVRPSRAGVGSAGRCTARADAPPLGRVPTAADPGASFPAHCLPAHRICADAPGPRFSLRTGEAQVMANRSPRHRCNPLTQQRMSLCQKGLVGQLFERREGRAGANSCEKGSVGVSPGTGRMARRPARRGGSRKTKRPTESGWPVFVVVVERHPAANPSPGQGRAPAESRGLTRDEWIAGTTPEGLLLQSALTVSGRVLRP